jgi:magnesium-transporting ATPase (P-type)
LGSREPTGQENVNGARQRFVYQAMEESSQAVAKKFVRDPPPPKAASGNVPDIASASVPDTLMALKVNPATGLSHAEVDTRRKEHGFNEVAEQTGHPVLKFLKKFWGISAWMLELIMVLSAVLGKYSDLIVVGALLVINAVLSFMQESRAAGVVEALRKQLQVNARVRRDTSWQVVPARELVPGDIVRVRPGDIIPADVKLLTGAMTIDQSVLTGESKDADKAPGGVLSSGSVVRRGEGNGVVMLTGAKTFFGRTTQLVQEARPKLHIEAGGKGRPLALRHRRRAAGRGDCAVADSRRTAPGNGSAHARAVDKRGAGRPARHVHGQHGRRVEGAGQTGCAGDTPQRGGRCRDNGCALRGQDRHPIDLAFLTAARERHVFDNLPKVTPVSFVPFDAKTRRTEAVVEQNGKRLRVMKGAVRTIAEACGLQLPAIEAWKRASANPH